MFIDLHGNVWWIHSAQSHNTFLAEVIVSATRSLKDKDGIKHTSWRAVGMQPGVIFTYGGDIFVCPD